MKKRFLLLTLLLVLGFVLVACSGGGLFGDDDDAWKTARLEQMTIDRCTYRVGEQIRVHATYSPDEWNLAPDGSEFEVERLSGYVYFTEQDRMVKVDEVGNSSTFGFSLGAHEALTTEDIVVYIAYCTHDTPHDGFEGDLVSDGKRISCQTPIATTAEEFIKYVTESESSNRSTTFALGADIDLGGMAWTPVEYNNATIWGMGHTVSNFTITATAAQNVGLFSTFAGTVRDLNIADVTINARGEGQNVGIFAGTLKHENEHHNTGTTVLQNVTVAGEINASYYNNVGGLAGCSNGVVLKNCKSEATVTGNTAVGGICGKVTLIDYSSTGKKLSADQELLDCVNLGSVGGKQNVGGVVGHLVTAASGVSVKGLVNNGAVTGTTSVGGVFGTVQGVNALWDLVNNGTVTGALGGSQTGGVCGYAEGTKYFYYCENTADINGVKYVGGIVGNAPAATLECEGVANNNTITGTSYVGGFAGACELVISAVNNGTVTTTGISSDGYAAVGGIAGTCKGALNCKNNADIAIAVRGDYVGGIAGLIYLLDSNKLVGNENIGEISGVGTCSYVGGLAGFLSTNATGSAVYTVSDNKNSGRIGGVNHVGGLFGEISAQAYISVSLLTNRGEVTATGNNVGGIVGKARRLTEISFCENKADITGTNYVGGIAGYAAGTVIKMGGVANYQTITGISYLGGVAGQAGAIYDAVNSGTISVVGLPELGDSYVGGIVGYGAALLNCINNSDITVNGAGNFVGGLAGLASVEGVIDCIVNCVNNGNVTSGGNFVGGIAGRLYSAPPSGKYEETHQVKNNENNGTVSGANVVGGLFGCVLGTNETIRDCAWCGYTTYYKRFEIKLCSNNGAVTGSSYVGGIVGVSTYLNNADTLADTNQNLYGDYHGKE